MLNMDISSCPLEDSEDASQAASKETKLRVNIENCMGEDSEDALEALLLAKNNKSI